MEIYQPLVRHVLFPLDAWRTGDFDRLRYLAEFEKTQYLPLDEIRDLQRRQLVALMDRAWRQCPFYRKQFERAGLVPSDIRTLEDLAAFPVLTKQDIQEHRDQMIARDWPREDLVANQTGGSTGCPLSFYLSQDRARSRAAATIRHNRWAGWDIGHRVAILWGAPRDRPSRRWLTWLRNVLLDRQLFLDTGHVTEDRLTKFNDALKRHRPRVILAYAQAVALFARFLKAKGLTTWQPAAIVTSAEVLDPADRAVVEEVFGCSVFNRYGCREVSVIASECAAHHGLHTMAEGIYVEIVKDSAPAAAGELGAIVVTDLRNLAMPLIRYRIGDLGCWDEGACPCGRQLPRLAKIAGRVTDFLVGSDGRLVSGAFLSLYLVGQRPSLGQVQILQERVGQVRFRIRPGASFQSRLDIDYLEQATRTYLGENSAVECELVDEIKPEPSGKYLFSRSQVAADQWISASPPKTLGSPHAVSNH